MKQDRVKIGTWPTPEKPVWIDIPIGLLKEFEKEARIIVRHPYIIGIPVPMLLLEKFRKDPRVFKNLTEKFDLMLVPRQ